MPHPVAAHGTNAASAVMAGLQVVVVACDAEGNVDLDDLRAQADAARRPARRGHGDVPVDARRASRRASASCATSSTSTAGRSTSTAPTSTLVGVAQPGPLRRRRQPPQPAQDVLHPARRRRPGVGPDRRAGAPRAVPARPPAGPRPPGAVGPVAAAPYGSAGILPISWAYIALMGAEGLLRATAGGDGSAPTTSRRLASRHFPVLYTGRNGLVAHECILDLRPITKATGVTVDDVAKRLMDHGFHAPTMSFPVAGTLMVEPTESEDLRELDRFCAAMIAHQSEIDRAAAGEWPAEASPLRFAPAHGRGPRRRRSGTVRTRELAAFPSEGLRVTKYFPPVGRIDAAAGDRNLVCSCPPIEELATTVG